jgi:hypothetical protein
MIVAFEDVPNAEREVVPGHTSQTLGLRKDDFALLWRGDERVRLPGKPGHANQRRNRRIVKRISNLK